MQRCGVENIRDKYICQLIGVNSFFFELAHDDIGIGGRLSYMLAGAFVTAFDHVCKNKDQAVLHLGDNLLLMFLVLNGGNHVLGRLGDGVIEVLDFVAGLDVQLAQAFNGLITGRSAVVCKMSG